MQVCVSLDEAFVWSFQIDLPPSSHLSQEEINKRDAKVRENPRKWNLNKFTKTIFLAACARGHCFFQHVRDYDTGIYLLFWWQGKICEVLSFPQIQMLADFAGQIFGELAGEMQGVWQRHRDLGSRITNLSSAVDKFERNMAEVNDLHAFRQQIGSATLSLHSRRI